MGPLCLHLMLFVRLSTATEKYRLIQCMKNFCWELIFLQGVDCANVYGFHRRLSLGSEGAKLFMVFPTIASSCCLLLRWVQWSQGPWQRGCLSKHNYIFTLSAHFYFFFHSFNDHRPPAETANQTTITLSLFLHIAVSAANKNESELTVNFATAQSSVYQKIKWR